MIYAFFNAFSLECVDIVLVQYNGPAEGPPPPPPPHFD